MSTDIKKQIQDNMSTPEKIDQVAERTQGLWEALRIEHNAAVIYSRESSEANLAALRAATEILIPMINAEHLAKAIYLLGHRHGFEKSIEEFQVQVGARMAARNGKETN